MKELSIEDLKRNQNLLLMYFLYTTFHGMLRKWVFVGMSGINNVLLAIQLIMPFLLMFLMKKEKNPFAYQPLVPYAAALILLALNPMNATLFHGIFGFIIHFGFWMVMIVYINERDSFPFEKLMPIFIIIGFAQICLTFVQFTLPESHFINRYESSDNVDGFENGLGVRVIGTFSYIAGYGSYLYFLGLFAWALMLENKKSLPIILGLSTLGLVSAFMSGSRGMVVAYVMSIVFGLASYGSFKNKLQLVAFVALVTLIGAIYGVQKNLFLAERAFTAFYGRVKYGQTSGEAGDRTTKTFFAVTDFGGKYPIFGLGLGATYQGATSKWGKSQELIENGYYEEEPERILLEGGYFLLIVRIFLFAFLAWQLKIPLIYSVPILFYLFFFTQMVFNTYQSTFTFFGLAMLDKMYYLKSLKPNGDTS